MTVPQGLNLIATLQNEMTVKQAFTRYPEEAKLIGELLTRYSDLEIFMMHCVQVVRNKDLDTVLKSMYRTRGESARIEIADALGRQRYHSIGLGAEFETAIGASHHCRKIRNQYAHCLWWDDYTGRLAFSNMEEIARQNDPVTDLRGLTPKYIDVAILESQSQFFTYTENLLKWLNIECRVRIGDLANNHVHKPAPLIQPGLNIPQIP